jgi:hypothetical protein
VTCSEPVWGYKKYNNYQVHRKHSDTYVAAKIANYTDQQLMLAERLYLVGCSPASRHSQPETTLPSLCIRPQPNRSEQSGAGTEKCKKLGSEFWFQCYCTRQPNSSSFFWLDRLPSINCFLPHGSTKMSPHDNPRVGHKVSAI